MTSTKPVMTLALVLMASVAMATADAKEFQTDAPPQTVSAGSIGGGWFVMATALFDLYDRNIEGLRYNTTPGGGVANPIAVQGGNATIAFSYTTNLFAAVNGQPPYEAEHPDLRAVVNFNAFSSVHPWILSSKGINSLNEFAEKQPAVRIDTGPRGTGGELAASRALELHGITYDDIRRWGGTVSHSNYREAVDRMKDGHIDMFMNDDLVGAALYSDLTTSRDVVLLTLDADAVEAMGERYGYGSITIPAGTYPGQTEDVLTTTQYTVMFAHKDVPEDLVYAMTRITFENMEHLGTVYAGFADMAPEVGPTGFPMDLHPGAERYYREIGVLE